MRAAAVASMVGLVAANAAADTTAAGKAVPAPPFVAMRR